MVCALLELAAHEHKLLTMDVACAWPVAMAACTFSDPSCSINGGGAGGELSYFSSFVFFNVKVYFYTKRKKKTYKNH